MPKPKSDPKAQLALKQEQLDLILAIDHVRDSIAEPSAMLAAIASILTDQFGAELCLLCLLDRDTGRVELKALDERPKRPRHLNQLISRELAEKAVHSDGTTVWKAEDVLPQLEPGSPLADLQLVTVPIILGADERLGAIVLAGSQPPFGPDDLQLLETAETQIDSAVAQGHAYHDLELRNKELETIYQVDHIRDLQLPFDDMLNQILQELGASVEAEAGFIMLYNHSEQCLELRCTTKDDLLRVAPSLQLIDEFSNEALHQAEIVCRNDLPTPIRSIVCIPLLLKDEIIGVLGVVNRYGSQGFLANDRRLLSAIGSQIDTAIFESLERRRLRRLLGRSVDPRVMTRLLADPDTGFLKGERATISVLYSDLRSSTLLAERTDPEVLVTFINECLSQMSELVLSHEGTLDKFVGDGVMALFGAPFPQPDHALRAVRVGLEMQAAHQNLIKTWSEHDIQVPPIGVGIATGELIAGEMGCPQRTDYTVIGKAANLGSRLCEAATGGQLLVSQATYDLVQDQVEAVPVTGLRLKGIDQHVTGYHVLRITG